MLGTGQRIRCPSIRVRPLDQYPRFRLVKGGQQRADQAHAELPDTVDTDEHSDLLGKFGVDPSELARGIGGNLGF